jgi:hypothetical protein
LWWGEASSLAEPRHGDRLADNQNLAVNLACALVLSIFGFLNLFRFWRKSPDTSMAVILFEDRILAPQQGVMSRTVEIYFCDTTHMKKLSVDGVWEFNVAAGNKHIRIPKDRLDRPADFDSLVAEMGHRVASVAVETEQRINPPRLDS